MSTEARLQPAAPVLKDPYAYHTEDVAEPPVQFGEILKRIGPGMILAASIVGSGELIATTTLGAEVGYLALWIIVISCFLKPAIQSEMGRFTIATGKTGLASFNLVPGPRFGVSWVVWMWAVMVLVTMFQIGAMFAGVAQVLNTLVPSMTISVWVLILLAFTLWLLLGGGYDRIEHLATLKVGLFTMLTLLCALMLTAKPQYFSLAQLAEGFTFQLPGGGLTTAVAVFGITGVGAAELFMYPYWCVEKGYARYTGPIDSTPEWRRRAHGWIKVMNVDILASMVIYTVATLAFYLLGAGVLHSQGLLPKGNEMIAVLSRMYTETLGPWALWLFYAGAIATLYGTIFAATAANSRVYADMVALLGVYDRGDYATRVQWRKRFIVGLLLIPVGLYFLKVDPSYMVKIGGVAQALMLPVIAIGTLYLRYKHMPKAVYPSTWVTITLWIASLFTIFMMGYYTILLVRG
ncbi:MAG TPA: Nramp family divalent metal transporter [Bryobacteraceae bacterium]|nr:Nramp family divalent metal transporter [Bryobacteraceae bacterium]